MTTDDATRLGFLLRCAEDGVSGDEAVGLYKTAIVTDTVIPTAQALGSALAQLGSSAVLTGVLGGGALGGVLGMHHGGDPFKLKPDPVVAELQKAEILAALRRQTGQVEQTRDLLQRRAERPVARSPFAI